MGWKRGEEQKKRKRGRNEEGEEIRKKEEYSIRYIICIIIYNI